MLFEDTPIIQAPMAGGITTPELVSAVCQAGGVGSFGFAYSTPEAISADFATARALTDGPINANFFIITEPEEPPTNQVDAALADLAEVTKGFDLSLRKPAPPYALDLPSQMTPLWQSPPRYVTFHFGLPPHDIMTKAKSHGCLVGITATCEHEIRQITAFGADFIILQGREAGGHHGTFSPKASPQRLSMNELLALAKTTTSLPLVCAGGIMTGQDIAHYLSAGAAAVQMGTAFLCCDEAGTNDVYRHFVMHEKDRKTIMTRAFSGRWARGIENDFTKAMMHRALMPFPMQNTLTGSMRQQATRQQNGEYQSLWAGANFPKSRAMSVQALMTTLYDEYHACLKKQMTP